MSKEKPSKSTVTLIRHFMRGAMAFYWVTFLLYFVDIVAYLLTPFFQQVYTDNIITRKNPEWFGPLMFFLHPAVCSGTGGMDVHEPPPQKAFHQDGCA